MTSLRYRRHRFPPEIIQHAIWLYLRFTLSHRDAEELLADRGLDSTALGAKVWSVDRAPAAPAAPSAERSVASRRNGGADRRRRIFTLACR